jgi:alpha-L-rhamnosidase
MAFCLISTSSNHSFSQSYKEYLYQNFQNPPDEARPMMRWWWFGPAVVNSELEKELQTMKAAGIGGVEIQPVYPLMLDDQAKGIKNLPYLSTDFLNAVTFANKTARSLGLRVDITLGSGWPYGGPHTTLALSVGRLRTVEVLIPPGVTTTQYPQLEEGETLISASVVAGEPKHWDASSAQPITQTHPPIIHIPPATTSRTALFFIASHTKQAVKRPAVGAEGYVLDHFSRAAIDEHLNDVATPLLNAFGNQPPYAVFSDSLEVYGSDWTANLPAEFKRRRGYDLIPHLPELVSGGTPEAEAVRHDWAETLSDLVRENYLAPINQFALNHNTKFRSQTYGLPAVTLFDEAIPSLPEGEGPQWRDFSFTRWASSASHLYNRNITSAETFTWLHSPAFRATPLDMKVEADRMFLLGVNQIIGHGWPYSPPVAGEPGLSLYAAAVFNNHNPWFPIMPDITRYLQRISWLLRQGEPANDVAILLPEDDAQAAFSPGHASVTEEMNRYITPELMAAILDAGYNIDYIDARTIDQIGIHHPILILPPTDRVSLATYRKIELYASKNGKIIAVGKLPSSALGLLEQSTSPQIADLSAQLFHSPDHHGIHIASTSDLPEALHHVLPPDMAATGEMAGIGFLHRKLPTSDIYFVANTSNKPIRGTIRFRSSRPVIESWNPDTAVSNTLARDANGAIPVSLAPYESRIFVLKQSTDPTSSAPIPYAEKHVTDLSTGWQIRFGDDSEPLPQLTSWTELPGRQFYSGEAIYTHSFTLSANPGHTVVDFGEGTPTIDTRPPNANGIHALLDPPIREAAVVYVNGKRAGSLWHPPYRLDITAFAHPGENTLEVHVDNTAINELAGQPSRNYTALNAKYGERFDPQDMDNLKPIPSGLVGTVRIITETEDAK